MLIHKQIKIMTSLLMFGGISSAVEYGVDVSFPIHYDKVSTNYAWLPHNIDPENNPTPNEYKGMPVQYLPDRQKFYDDFLQGCRDFYGKKAKACDETEGDRLEMSLRQPKSVMNYTDTGFKKIRAPKELYEILREYWEKNRKHKKLEKWHVGYTYTNHWTAPSYMVSIEDSTLDGGGYELKQKVWNMAREPIQEWTGQKLKDVSVYGIREYTTGAVLSPHVDRFPLISSAIINVDQDVDEDWVLEVIGRDGMAHNVSMQPGDMVLYESHSLIHARPFALKGRFYANVFIHFEPVGDDEDSLGSDDDDGDRLPSYILQGSQEEINWRQEHPNSRPASVYTQGRTPAHVAAQHDDIEALSQIVIEDNGLTRILQKDENGWVPLHEAARAGSVKAVKFLLKHSADVNERTYFGEGGSPLYWAEHEHGPDHMVVHVLKRAGATNIPPTAD